MKRFARLLREDFARLFREDRSLAIALIIVVLGLAAILVIGTRNQRLWVRACEARGGHEHGLFKASVCVSADGRILEDN